MPHVLQYVSGLWFEPVGTPSDCTPGNVQDTPVRSCKVCLTNLELVMGPGYGMSVVIKSARIRRANYTFTFKRAISYDQPNVAPTDGTQGVWVPIVAERTMYGPPAPPIFEEIVAKDLEPADVEPLGLTMTGVMGGWEFSVRRPGYLGTFANNKVLLEWLGTAEAVARYKAIVGDCSGIRGALDQP